MTNSGRMDSTGLRSGMCYEDTAPQMHAACSGRRRRIDGSLGINEIVGACECPCHTNPLSHLFFQKVQALRARMAVKS